MDIKNLRGDIIKQMEKNNIVKKKLLRSGVLLYLIRSLKINKCKK